MCLLLHYYLYMYFGIAHSGTMYQTIKSTYFLISPERMRETMKKKLSD